MSKVAGPRWQAGDWHTDPQLRGRGQTSEMCVSVCEAPVCPGPFYTAAQDAILR
eukprot:CAMPEP_0174364130 /NCGR_PEP_ID=MMETSP0811_2-20130205/71641_1 /TAXON_ID=73025 ORGANISM="Eutreptiella gymnastica-like, Strain CCMP1594" /NCGR_SAMPLE_ID=MMETSP0811_2 /ASSEMBLY_ACC=CAM_ASM_000667 /LENGTH=53 /DNA_ID=CAMNT_0015503481 /DNA_START=95 /DNA_END=253 /DNA_ORIENTATION=-